MLAPVQDLIVGIWHYIVPFLLMITPIIFFHELGHFLMARACGVRIETFSIGFGPALASWNDRFGTRWKIASVPLGGYVKFFGDDNAASIPDRERLDGLSAGERQVAFPLKALWQRALIVAAGPAANFVLAIVILTAFLMALGTYAAAPEVSRVVPGSAAAAAGFRAGDTILAVNGSPIEEFGDIRSFVWERAGQSLAVQVRRGSHTLLLHVTPRLTRMNMIGGPQKVGLLGIDGPPPSQWKHVGYGFFSAVGEACNETWSVVATTFDQLGRIFTGDGKSSQISGPIGIAKLSGDVAAVSWLSLFRLAALISISIGLVNLFPIPILDGGHLLYYGFEAVLGRPLGARAQDVGFRLGLAVMVGLMLLAAWNDLVRLNLF
ncbi:MAG TPA: RIP metalloprotease RseP [Bradyrhizobium sp.]|nr:RIP metalloprotease RseP [Rhizomicrobium sp.]HUO00968.1 RIP metalloprotease RseP [Bradyrhizobium sp.]